MHRIDIEYSLAQDTLVLQFIFLIYQVEIQQYVTQETFLVQFLGPTGTFWGLLIFVELLVELFRSVQVVFKKH